jgi:hypothetical protein
MTVTPIQNKCDVPIWACLFPNRYMFAQRNKILKYRDPWDVFILWQRVNIDLNQVGIISKIIASTAGWSNSLFIPNDSIWAMVTDYDGSFIDIHIWHELEISFFHKKIDYPEQWCNNELSYLDFLRNTCILSE